VEEEGVEGVGGEWEEVVVAAEEDVLAELGGVGVVGGVRDCECEIWGVVLVVEGWEGAVSE